MAGYTPGVHFYANGGDFFIFDPYSCETFQALCSNAKGGHCLDKRLLQVPHIARNAARASPKTQDWISNELAGAMESDVAASIHAVYSNIHGFQHPAGRQKVTFITTTAQGVRCRMLDEQKQIGRPVLGALFDLLLL
jgi:hypothetical protein